jgi:hypothetical protein
MDFGIYAKFLRGILFDSHSPPSGRLFWSFNWYQSWFGHLLVLTDFMTWRRHGEMCCQACGLQWWGFWLLKNPTRNYVLRQGRAIWEIVQETYVTPAMLNNVTQGELQRYKNNYKVLNLITTTFGRNAYDRVCDRTTSGKDSLTRISLSDSRWSENTINTHKYNTIL